MFIRLFLLPKLLTLALLALLPPTLANAPTPNKRTHSQTLVTTPHPQVLRGAELYYQHCSVCHGDTALGLAEARLAFPNEHQTCERCHRRNNPPQMDINRMMWRNTFNIGSAPALRGRGALVSLRSGAALYSYTQATMPRPFPSSLEPDVYRDITLFLLHINGAGLPMGELTHDDLTTLTIPTPDTKPDTKPNP